MKIKLESRWKTGLLATLIGIDAWLTVVGLAEALKFHELATNLYQWGTIILFFVGLGWAVWILERCSHYAETHDDSPISWNPLNPNAWYYGRQSQKYKQSLTVLSIYSCGFVVLLLMLSMVDGCGQREVHSPQGGGKDQITPTVKIQKIVKKKYVINPYSSILFNPPPLDKIELKIMETTQHRYKVGQGQGEGAGFSGGTKSGKVRFFRLRYNGGDWDQDYGVGGDLNLLIQYGIMTGQKVAKKTEDVTASELGRFKRLASPPLIYITGQKSISLNAREKKILRNYVLDRHGMIFGDNGGSRHFHNQFLSLMREITGAREVAVPLDDYIHMRPNQIPFLPYVSPHGGKVALGWKVNGRWVAYYHPGDIGDAWADGHAGVSRSVSNACYQLGINIIYYAYAEHNKWKESQKKP